MGKGSKNPDPPPVDTTKYDAQNQQMMEMMAMMTAMQQAQLEGSPPPPALPAQPLVNDMSGIDWSERNLQLAERARADYELDETRRKGRRGTILTSPLNDELSPETTGGSILTPGDGAGEEGNNAP